MPNADKVILIGSDGVNAASVTNPIPITGGSSGSTTNIVQVAGASVATGHGTAAGSLRVELPTDGTGIIAGVTTVTALTGGGVAGGATDSGNPVKIGAKNNSTKPTYSDGQRTDLQSDTRGNIQAALWVANSATPVSGGLSFGDTISNTSAYLSSGAFALGFDGTQWVRLRATVASKVLYTEAGPYLYSRKTADGQVSAAAGFIHTVTISPNGEVVAGTLSIYDSLTETGTVIFSVALPITTFTSFSVTIDAAITTGIYVGYDATLANVAVTVSYR